VPGAAPQLAGFTTERVQTSGGVTIHTVKAGKGPPLLLMHGAPLTHYTWRDVAPKLAEQFTVVATDLRGYGDSDQPKGLPDHSNYAKRAMAQDMVEVMRSLGFDRFAVGSHDRGARVTHRMCVDHSGVVSRAALLDISLTRLMYAKTNFEFAKAYYHWFFLIQPAPLPERMIGGDPAFFLRWTLGGWGSNGLGHIEPEALADYERCFCRADAIRAACEDYRAAASIDLEHDRASRAAGEKITADVLVLWGERGLVGRMFDPLAIWGAQCAGTVSGSAMPSGHFIPEELPDDTARRLRDFFLAA
jgi:haloacetate dehalogenase